MSNTDYQDGEAGLKVVERHVAQLSEHFDCVQVFVTRHSAESSETRCCQAGSGNWYARFGQVKEWLIKEERRIELALEEEME